MKYNRISYTVDNTLCTGCGICQGACPSKAISFIVRNGKFEPQIDYRLCNNDKGCHRCMDVCAGVGIDMISIANERLYFDGTNTDAYIGNYLQCFSGYSKNQDLRYHAGSGGMVSQLLIWLLEKGYIQGAVVTKFDPKKELFVNSFIATTCKEILLAKSSKYSPVSLNNIIHDIKMRDGKYIIVGLPCHIQGFRKFEKLDKGFKEKIFGYFGIYCSGTRTFNFTEYLLKERGYLKDELSYLSYRDEGCLGGLVIEGIKNGGNYHYYEDYQRYSHPLRSIFYPRRCLFCIDHFAELADISFGDIHVKPYSDDKVGINSVIVRNIKWISLLKKAVNDKAIKLETLDVEILKKSQMAVKSKKHRLATFIKLDKMLRHKVPKYDIELHDSRTLHSLIAYFWNMMQIFIGAHKKMWFIIKLIKARVKKDL